MAQSKEGKLEKARIAMRVYRAKNKELLKERRKLDSEKRVAQVLRWRANNPEFYIEISRRHDKKRYPKRKAARLKKLEDAAGRPRPDKCEVCGRPPGKKAIAWDHCHVSGKFRGWICGNCNSTLGYCNDDPNILKALLKYLEQHKA